MLQCTGPDRTVDEWRHFDADCSLHETDRVAEFSVSGSSVTRPVQWRLECNIIWRYSYRFSTRLIFQRRPDCIFSYYTLQIHTDYKLVRRDRRFKQSVSDRRQVKYTQCIPACVVCRGVGDIDRSLSTVFATPLVERDEKLANCPNFYTCILPHLAVGYSRPQLKARPSE